MRIGIAGPISKESIAQYLGEDAANLPKGYAGAPLLGTLIGALIERGHSVTAYTTSNDLELSKRVTAIGKRFKITFCPQRPRAFRYHDGHLGRAADLFRHERLALAAAMRSDAPDLIHAHWSYEFAQAAIESELPNLVTCHDAPQVVLRYTPDPYRLSRYIMARKVFSKAKNLTAVSPYLRDMLVGYTRAPIVVVPNPLPPQSVADQSPPHIFEPDSPRISMVLNGWSARKNPQPALRAFALLRQQKPNAKLYVMGTDFGANGKAEHWARLNGLEHGVSFLGPQPYKTVLTTLAASDLLLHPSLEETFGMSIAEAMSLRVPVVGGQASGAVPWVMGEGGIAVNVRSAQSIADGMFQIFCNPRHHAKLGTAARNTAMARFSAETVAIAYEQEYKRALFGPSK